MAESALLAAGGKGSRPAKIAVDDGSVRALRAGGAVKPAVGRFDGPQAGFINGGEPVGHGESSFLPGARMTDLSAAGPAETERCLPPAVA